MKKIVFCSYATAETPYIDVINKFLIPSLKKFNLEYDIEYPEDRGSWQANTSYKSEFILKMLHKHEGSSIVFLDSDAEVKKYPSLFWEIPNEYDIGVHFLNWMWRWRKQKDGNKFHLLSGTMYLNYNSKVIGLVEEFIEEISKSPNTIEQRSMEVVVNRRKDLKVYELPYSYIVFPNQNNTLPLHMLKEKDIVIYHNQASRRLKNRHNKEWIKTNN